MLNRPLNFVHIMFLMFIVSIVNSQTCNQSCQVVVYNPNMCWICYKSCSPPQQYSINTCQIRYCKFFFGSTCVYYDYRFINTKTCMSQCCGIIKLGGQTYTSRQTATCLGININQNNPDNNPDNNITQSSVDRTIYILVGSIVAVALIVILIIYCFCKEKIKSCLCGDNNNDGARQEIQNIYHQKQDYTIKTVIVDSQINFRQSMEQICSICLSDSTNIRTACGHWFHFKCIFQWLQKNYKCPNCVNQEISPISIVCKKCQKMSFRIYLKKKTKWQRLKKSAQNCKCQKCLQYLQLNQ